MTSRNVFVFFLFTKVLVEFLLSLLFFWNWKFLLSAKKRQSIFFYQVVIDFEKYRKKKSEGYKTWAFWCCLRYIVWYCVVKLISTIIMRICIILIFMYMLYIFNRMNMIWYWSFFYKLRLKCIYGFLFFLYSILVKSSIKVARNRKLTWYSIDL